MGPLLGSQVEKPAKPSRHASTRLQLRPAMNRRNTMCENKSHDLLLPEARPASTSHHALISTRANYAQAQPNQSPSTLRRQLKCSDRFGTKHISSLGKDYRSDSFRLTSSRPALIQVHNGARTQVDQASDSRHAAECAPSRQSFGTARRIRRFRTPSLYSQRRLSWRGARHYMLTLRRSPRQTLGRR